MRVHGSMVIIIIREYSKGSGAAPLLLLVRALWLRPVVLLLRSLPFLATVVFVAASAVGNFPLD